MTTAIWIVLFALVIADSLLRLVLLCLRWLLRPRPLTPEFEPAGCIVLIAARDEAGSIGPTVASLLPHLAEWPDSRLWVIADHCEDDTGKQAEKAGARVAPRLQGSLGKGAAISWWLAHHSIEWRDRSAIVVLDADSQLKPGSLRLLRQAFASGADAAQSFVAPRATATMGRLAGWSEVLMQRIDDEARNRAGWQVPLRGAGMALRTELLAELAPRLHTLAEDLELDVLLAARTSRVLFVPEAIVLDTKPRHAGGISRQRARWMQGQLQVLRDYRREILRSLMHGGMGAWLLLCLLLLRPKVLFIAIRLLALAVGLWLGGPWWIVVAGLAMDVAYYVSGVAIADDPQRYLLDLLAAPRYAAIWVYSLGVAAVRRGWLRAGR